ncbi:iron-sulfur cluster repair protein YtfE [Thalassolituus marinus]|uniref:Iron-sulfur cluster repair protein YtfE n=1 Tax=Thalassolituus marinus TaxID=671053 RepID=A0ABS7ZPU2_9GAMM|nr:iron-sulfur cluster repair protein YtfE [Thalassolituus marinus]MCA6063726.1 iron-sulfur cluster repair protein YtfE [Thalassolituus marinus]
MEMLQRPLCEVATSVPGASGILRTFNINFCTQGDVSLAQALQSCGADVQEVTGKILSVADETDIKDWSEYSSKELISYILERFHERHRQQLPELIMLATKVERVHSDSSACPHGLSALLRDVKADLENHMQKEEQILFPMLAGGMYPGGPISVMQGEHDDHLQTIADILRITNELQLPSGACTSWRNLYLGLTGLIDDLMEHITLENYFLFVPGRQVRDGSCCGCCQ